MPPLNLNEAAKIAHKSKSTVLKAIRTGRLSATRNDKNEWQIDPAELFRVYPFKISEQANTEKREQENPKETEENKQANNEYKEKFEVEKAERLREREQMQTTIDDLRKRLDEEAEERRKLTKLLTHQPASTLKKENSLFKKIFGKKS